MKSEMSECIGGISDHKWGGQYHQQDRVYSMGDQALALNAQIPRGSYLYMEVKKLGNIYGFTGGNFAGSVWDKEGCSPTISTMQGGGQEPMIVQTVAMRGRGEPGHIKQNLEIRGDIANTLTSVEKDNLVMEIKMPKELNKWVWEINGTKYLIRIRKLTPRECWRLMTFSDEDFDKAASVNSNTQLYKQAGNAIVKDVIADIIRQLM